MSNSPKITIEVSGPAGWVKTDIALLIHDYLSTISAEPVLLSNEVTLLSDNVSHSELIERVHDISKHIEITVCTTQQPRYPRKPYRVVHCTISGSIELEVNTIQDGKHWISERRVNPGDFIKIVGNDSSIPLHLYAAGQWWALSTVA